MQDLVPIPQTPKAHSWLPPQHCLPSPWNTGALAAGGRGAEDSFRMNVMWGPCPDSFSKGPGASSLETFSSLCALREAQQVQWQVEVRGGLRLLVPDGTTLHMLPVRAPLV